MVMSRLMGHIVDLVRWILLKPVFGREYDTVDWDAQAQLVVGPAPDDPIYDGFRSGDWNATEVVAPDGLG